MRSECCCFYFWCFCTLYLLKRKTQTVSRCEKVRVEVEFWSPSWRQKMHFVLLVGWTGCRRKLMYYSSNMATTIDVSMVLFPVVDGVQVQVVVYYRHHAHLLAPVNFLPHKILFAFNSPSFAPRTVENDEGCAGIVAWAGRGQERRMDMFCQE